MAEAVIVEALRTPIARGKPRGRRSSWFSCHRAAGSVYESCGRKIRSELRRY